MQIIDFHVHAGDFSLLRDDIQQLLTRRPMEPEFSLAQVFSQPATMEHYLSRHGVVRAIVLAECGPGTNFTIDSELIVNHCAGNEFFVPYGNINPHHHDVISEFWKSVRLGVKGFKFYPADHAFDAFMPAMKEVYRLCEAMGLPILFHTGFAAQRDASQKFINPMEFTPLFEDCPGLSVILAHGGKPLWFREAVEVITTYPNVYIDTALLDPLTLQQDFPDLEKIQDKVLFGSDWPVVGSYTALMEKFRQAAIPGSILSKIFYENGARVLAQAEAKQRQVNPQAQAMSV